MKSSPKKPKNIEKNEISRKNNSGFSQKILNLFEKKTLFFTFLTILFLGIFTFRNFLLLKYLYFFKDIGSDSVNVEYPAMKMHDRFFNEGIFPNWTFFSGMGFPTFSSLTNDFITNALWNFIKIIGNFQINSVYQFPFFVLYYILIIGILSYFYLRSLEISKFTASVGTILFSFLGFTIVASSWNLHFDIVRGIILLFAFEQFFKKNRWYFFPIAVLYISSNLYYIYLFGAFLFIYATFRFFDEKGFQLKQFSTFIIKLSGLAILGVMINLVFALPVWMMIFNSPRVSGNSALFNQMAKETEVSHFLEYVTAVLRTFSTDLMGNGNNFKGWQNYFEAPTFYCGLITLLLIPQIFGFLNKKQKIIYGLFLGFWFLILAIPYLRRAFLLFVGDYYRVGINLFVPVVMLFFGLNALQRIEKSYQIQKITLIFTLVGLLFLLFFPYFSKAENVVDSSLQIFVAMFLLIYAGLLFGLSVSQNKILFKSLIFLMVLFEITFFTSQTVNKRLTYSVLEYQAFEFGYKDATILALDYLKTKEKDFYRLEKDFASSSAMPGSLNDAQAQGYFGTASYSSFNQIFYIYFLEEMEIIRRGFENESRWSAGLRGYPLLQSIASVKYHLTKEEKSYLLNTGFSSVGRFEYVVLLRNNYFLPLGFTYEKSISLSEFRKLSKFQKSIMLFQGFVLDEKNAEFNVLTKTFPSLSVQDSVGNFSFEKYSQFIKERKSDTLSITYFSQDKIVGNVNLKIPKMMFFSIPYDKGWKAIVDGQEQILTNINIGFMGLKLDSGKHEIELRYRNPYFAYSLSISLLGLFIFLGLVVFHLKFRREILKSPKVSEK